MKFLYPFFKKKILWPFLLYFSEHKTSANAGIRYNQYIQPALKWYYELGKTTRIETKCW